MKYLSCFSVLFFITSCNTFSVNGYLGASNTIDESKERNVFVQEYTVTENPYIVNDSVHIRVKSAWLEHQWRYTGNSGDKAKKEEEGYQLLLLTDTSSLKNFGKRWLIGITARGSFRIAGKNAIICDFEGFPVKKDTLKWEVQEGDDVFSVNEKKIIGTFLLIAKSNR